MKPGWTLSTIGSTCDVVNGGTPKTGVAAFWDGSHRWITPAEMGKRSSPYVDTTSRTLTDAGLQASNLLPAGSVILSSRAPIGYLVINTVPMAFNQGCKGLVPKAELDHKYLYYFLLGNVELLESLGTGATFKELSGGKLKEVSIPFPSLAEQQRIVTILDEAFDGIATAKANADKNLRNARALLESQVRTALSPGGKGFTTRTLESVCAIFVDSAHRTPKYLDEGIPALRPRDVVGGVLNLQSAARVSDAEYEVQAKRYRPKGGDIVYSRELSLGWAAILPQSPTVCLSQGMCVFRPNEEVDAHFLLYVLNGPIGREQALHAAVGAAHPHINLGDIKTYKIPCPPKREQLKIVAELEVRAKLSQRLESLYQQKLAALSELKKSLLHEAFSGKL